MAHVPATAPLCPPADTQALLTRVFAILRADPALCPPAPQSPFSTLAPSTQRCRYVLVLPGSIPTMLPPVSSRVSACVCVECVCGFVLGRACSAAVSTRPDRVLMPGADRSEGSAAAGPIIFWICMPAFDVAASSITAPSGACPTLQERRRETGFVSVRVADKISVAKSEPQERCCSTCEEPASTGPQQAQQRRPSPLLCAPPTSPKSRRAQLLCGPVIEFANSPAVVWLHFSA